MPITGKVKQELTKEQIFSKVSQEDIYTFYLGCAFKDGVPICSPFHKDERPSFSIKENDKNMHMFKDFADDSHEGNCIDFVMQLFNLSFYEALVKINNDFALGSAISDKKVYQKMVNELTHTPRRETVIQVVSRKFTPNDYEYWRSYHLIKEDLTANQVYSIKKIIIKGDADIEDKVILIDVDELCYGYLLEDKWKIYRPQADKKKKWMTNIPLDKMFGLEKVKPGTQRCFVAKAKKDEMVLSKFLPCVVSTQNESKYAISEDNALLLQSSCDEVYTIFDNDDVGVNASRYYNQFGFKWVNCPKGYTTPEGLPIKDFADLARYHGMDIVVNYFKSKNLI